MAWKNMKHKEHRRMTKTTKSKKTNVVFFHSFDFFNQKNNITIQLVKLHEKDNFNCVNYIKKHYFSSSYLNQKNNE